MVMIVKLISLQYVDDPDCRLYKKDHYDVRKNERDWLDWLQINELQHKYQKIIRRDYLHHYFPVRVYDLGLALRRDYLLSWLAIERIIKHVTQNNKFIEVDKLNQDDVRKFHLYLFPRFPVNLQVPHSVFSIEYYLELRRLNTQSMASAYITPM